MIHVNQIIPLILDTCPGFRPTWEKHRALWHDEEAGIYNDAAEVATYIVDCYGNGDTEPIGAAFGVIEELLVTGDEEVRAAASIGFLEDVRNISSWRPFGSNVFIQWLGPQSRLAWADIEELWRGKNSLADVVRAEKAAAKNKR
jgi:hypothetical protein